MNADESMKLINGLYKNFAKGEVQPILDQLADQVNWATDAAGSGAPWYGQRTGPTEVASFFAELAGAVEVNLFKPVSMTGAENRVMAYIDYEITAKATGRKGKMHLHHYFGLDQSGKINFFRGSEDTALTLELLGR